MYSDSTGKLDVGRQVRTGGKAIDEWTYQSPFRSKDAPKLSAKISIDKSDRNEFIFVAHSDSLPQAIVDTDINRLRKKVDDEFRHQHDVLTGVTWEDWLEVQVRGRYAGRDSTRTVESDLKIMYCSLKRGVHPVTGIAYVINMNGIAVPFPSPKQAGDVDPDVERDTPESVKRLSGYSSALGGRDKEAEYSYLPATPENIAALNDLLERMQTLRNSLSAFLRQDVVLDSLAGRGATVPALPAPL